MPVLTFTCSPGGTTDLPAMIREIEKQMIALAIKESDNSLMDIAKRLGYRHHETVRKKIRRYSLVRLELTRAGRGKHHFHKRVLKPRREGDTLPYWCSICKQQLPEKRKRKTE